MNFANPVFRHAAFLSGLALAVPTGLRAQASCSDLVVEHMWYAAFDSTGVEVVLTNNGNMWFTGPTMELVNANLDTIAAGQLEWFVLPSGTHTHTLSGVQGMPLPENPFIGQALLHYQTQGGPEVCLLPLNALELCPPGPCTEFYLGIHETDTLMLTTIDWSVTDDDGLTVASGAITIDTISPYQFNDTLCLPPGSYELHVTQAVPSPFGQFYCKLYRDPMTFPDPHVLIDGDDMGHLPFTYYLPCAEDDNSIAEPATSDLRWSLLDGVLQLSSIAGEAIGPVSLIDARGASIATRSVNASTTSFDLTGQAPGLYIISTSGANARCPQRFILH